MWIALLDSRPTKGEARRSLLEAIALILKDRRDGLRGVPASAERETVASLKSGTAA